MLCLGPESCQLEKKLHLVHEAVSSNPTDIPLHEEEDEVHLEGGE